MYKSSVKVQRKCDLKLSQNLPQFCGNQTHRRSHRLHSWDPAGYLRLIDSCNFKILDILKRSWLATAPAIWNRLPADLILWGETYG